MSTRSPFHMCCQHGARWPAWHDAVNNTTTRGLAFLSSLTQRRFGSAWTVTVVELFTFYPHTACYSCTGTAGLGDSVRRTITSRHMALCYRLGRHAFSPALTAPRVPVTPLRLPPPIAGLCASSAPTHRHSFAAASDTYRHIAVVKQQVTARHVALSA